MTSTVIKSGQFITATSTEQEFYPELGGRVLLELILVSGSAQLTATAEFAADSPVIDSTYTTLSTAGDKVIIEVEKGVRHLRVKGSGVVNTFY